MSKMFYDEHPDAQHDIHRLHVVLLGERTREFARRMRAFLVENDFGSQVLLSCLSFQQGDDFGRRLRLWSQVSLYWAQGPCYYGRRLTRAPDLARRKCGFQQVEANIFINVYDQVEVFWSCISNPPIRAGEKGSSWSITFWKLWSFETWWRILTIVIQKTGAPSAESKNGRVFGNCRNP